MLVPLAITSFIILISEHDVSFQNKTTIKDK